MAYNKAQGEGDSPRRRPGIRRRKKVCIFCGKDKVIDYKAGIGASHYVSSGLDCPE